MNDLQEVHSYKIGPSDNLSHKMQMNAAQHGTNIVYIATYILRCFLRVAPDYL